MEFTKRFSTSGKETMTLFQRRLQGHGIRHKLIRPSTPRHNGKVERSHRKDNERFYASHTFYSFEDFSKQLQIYNRKDYNQFPMRPLGWKSPQTVLKEFIAFGVTYVVQTYNIRLVVIKQLLSNVTGKTQQVKCKLPLIYDAAQISFDARKTGTLSYRFFYSWNL